MKDLSIGGNTPDPRNQQGPGGGQSNLSEDQLEKLDNITCDNCGRKTFNSALQFKEIPNTHVASPPGGGAIQPVQVFACVGCGQSVNDQLQ